MNKNHETALVWMRRDLRLIDNPALSYATSHAKSVIVIYIHAPKEDGNWEIGGASKWWLHHSLKSLSQKFEKVSNQLILKKSDSSLQTILDITSQSNCSLVCWNRLYDPMLIKRDTEIKTKLKSQEIVVETFNSSLLKEPWELKTTTGGPYQVFTPFWRTLQKNFISEPIIKAPKEIKISTAKIKSDKLEDLDLLPKISWDKEFYNLWEPGEDSAQKKVKKFLNSNVQNYKENRDFPSLSASSTLSPHLHFGEISPRDIWQQAENNKELIKTEIEPFIRQLAWRDFAHHLLFHFPHTESAPLKKAFEKFPWNKNKKKLLAWQKGLTGFPIIDAGMRELYETGIMHNRVRMIVGSLLVKNLRIHWLEGAKWFWDCLLDADLANNSLGWQWVAGSGADASPYFRIFNPISQSEKFDSNGIYIRKWVPELNKLPNKFIHKPWDAPEHILKDAGITLGKNYPNRIVDLKESRDEALEAYFSLKNN